MERLYTICSFKSTPGEYKLNMVIVSKRIIEAPTMYDDTKKERNCTKTCCEAEEPSKREMK